MPRTVDLFLDSDQPLDRVAEQLGELSSARFVSSPDHAYFVAHAGDVVAHLTAHDFLDDDDLPLSEFRYVLSASVRPGELDRGQPGTGVLAPGQLRAAPGRGLCLIARHRPRATGHGPGGRPVSRGRQASPAFPPPRPGPAQGQGGADPPLARGPGPGWPCRHHGAAGRFDESERHASHDELAAAQILVAEGHQVRTVAERQGARTADLDACGTSVEVKGFQALEQRGGRPPGTPSVANKILDARGQGAVVMVRAGESGLTRTTAQAGYALFCDRAAETGLGRLRAVRVLGKDFDISLGPVADVQANPPSTAEPPTRAGTGRTGTGSTGARTGAGTTPAISGPGPAGLKPASAPHVSAGRWCSAPSTTSLAGWRAARPDADILALWAHPRRTGPVCSTPKPTCSWASEAPLREGPLGRHGAPEVPRLPPARLCRRDCPRRRRPGLGRDHAVGRPSWGW